MPSAPSVPSVPDLDGRRARTGVRRSSKGREEDGTYLADLWLRLKRADPQICNLLWIKMRRMDQILSEAFGRVDEACLLTHLEMFSDLLVHLGTVLGHAGELRAFGVSSGERFLLKTLLCCLQSFVAQPGNQN